MDGIQERFRDLAALRLENTKLNEAVRLESQKKMEALKDAEGERTRKEILEDQCAQLKEHNEELKETIQQLESQLSDEKKRAFDAEVKVIKKL